MIFVGVEGTLLYALVRFRKRKGRVAVQIHGNTRLEIGWTLGAAVVLVALAIAHLRASCTRSAPPTTPGPAGSSVSDGVRVRDDRRDSSRPKGALMTIQVNGIQYLWRYTYLGYRQARTGSATPTPTTTWSCRRTRR